MTALPIATQGTNSGYKVSSPAETRPSSAQSSSRFVRRASAPTIMNGSSTASPQMAASLLSPHSCRKNEPPNNVPASTAAQLREQVT